ncbi:MAG: methyltransferase domain-containing protein, partial [Bacteroidota bacterium]
MTKNLNEYYQKNYTALASTYDETRFGGAKREFSRFSKNEAVMAFFREYNIPKNAVITDVASGAGRILHCLLKNGYTNINATDLTQAMLDVSEKNVPQGTKQFVHYHCADMKKL